MDIFIYIFNIIPTVNIDNRNLSYKLSSELNNLALITLVSQALLLLLEYKREF